MGVGSEMNNRSEISVIKIQASCPLHLIHERTLTTCVCVLVLVFAVRVAHALVYSFVAYQFYMRHASDHPYLLSSATATCEIRDEREIESVT